MARQTKKAARSRAPRKSGQTNSAVESQHREGPDGARTSGIDPRQHRTSGYSPPKPALRRLRVFAFDPTLGMRLETAVLNTATLRIPWEPSLRPGPCGEYLEIIDHDPASNCFYAPVDLDNPYLLAQDGLNPAEGNPQFHQQMVYAVAMTTIGHFERALGRRALWAPRRYDPQGNRIKAWSEQYVPRLRIYPHGLREANAYYSPDKQALLFGYFPAAGRDAAGSLPGGMVFSALSHDIIAHETTHALLDGLHRRFNDPSNPDVLAFHEAFADIVALFQHFTYPEAIKHQIAQTRGDLRRQNLLGGLALQFGQALGNHGALRDAIGSFDEQGNWRPHEPSPQEYEAAEEPHARGAILVAAVFDAYLAIYRARIQDLIRLATGGSGVLGDGELHPDLVHRLADEATRSARHVLLMCIRALDYCPPVDITFGEYLRAILTADCDLVPQDDRHYRIAFVEAFRRRGIYPHDVRTLSVDSLLWRTPPEEDGELMQRILPRNDELGTLRLNWDMRSDRRDIFLANLRNAQKVHQWIRQWKVDVADQRFSVAQAGYRFGLDLGQPWTKFEVHSVRPARRVGPDGQQRIDWIVEITQRRPAWFRAEKQADRERRYRTLPPEKRPRPDFFFRGGCTLVVDAETAQLRYVVQKNILSERRLERERAYRTSSASLYTTYFSSPGSQQVAEPFAMLHRVF